MVVLNKSGEVLIDDIDGDILALVGLESGAARVGHELDVPDFLILHSFDLLHGECGLRQGGQMHNVLYSWHYQDFLVLECLRDRGENVAELFFEGVGAGAVPDCLVVLAQKWAHQDQAADEHVLILLELFNLLVYESQSHIH